LAVTFEAPRCEACRWISAADRAELTKFINAYPSSMAADLDGSPVFMASSLFTLRYEQERWPHVAFTDIKDYQKVVSPG
jgi:peptide chain release factor 3